MTVSLIFNQGTEKMQDYARIDNVYCLKELMSSNLKMKHVLRLTDWPKTAH